MWEPKDHSMDSYGRPAESRKAKIRDVLDNNPLVVDEIRDHVNKYKKNDRIVNSDICYSVEDDQNIADEDLGHDHIGPYIRPSFKQYCDEVNKTGQYTIFVLYAASESQGKTKQYWITHFENGGCGENFDVVEGTYSYSPQIEDLIQDFVVGKLCRDGIWPKSTITIKTAETKTTTTTTTTTTTEDESSNLALIVGIVVGSIAIVGTIAGIYYYQGDSGELTKSVEELACDALEMEDREEYIDMLKTRKLIK